MHDFTDLDHALIHIVNGHISGREIGCPASELNMRRLFEEENFPDTIINFASRNTRGQLLKSSSLKEKLLEPFVFILTFPILNNFKNFWSILLTQMFTLC